MKRSKKSASIRCVRAVSAASSRLTRAMRSTRDSFRTRNEERILQFPQGGSCRAFALIILRVVVTTFRRSRHTQTHTRSLSSSSILPPSLSFCLSLSVYISICLSIHQSINLFLLFSSHAYVGKPPLVVSHFFRYFFLSFSPLSIARTRLRGLPSQKAGNLPALLATAGVHCLIGPPRHRLPHPPCHCARQPLSSEPLSPPPHASHHSHGSRRIFRRTIATMHGAPVIAASLEAPQAHHRAPVQLRHTRRVHHCSALA